MKDKMLFIFSLILLFFGLRFSPQGSFNKYAFYIIAYVVPFLLLYYLSAKYIFKRYRARKVFISKRNLDKYLNEDKYH
jgi:hypothetical protein